MGLELKVCLINSLDKNPELVNIFGLGLYEPAVVRECKHMPEYIGVVGQKVFTNDQCYAFMPYGYTKGKEVIFKVVDFEKEFNPSVNSGSTLFERLTAGDEIVIK